ncbi:MAG: pyridoxamine 5'-phosphate oxidase family protein [Bacteroidales bacterium]|nr:pyridoxamine 5'-phosphate oxidase family protein [Bacteroidales bacterium]
MMERKMRRFKQQLPAEECMEILRRTTSGVLALCGQDMMPYAVPLSHAVDGHRLIFHCAKEGHKLDLIRQNGNASFCVIDQDEVHPESFTTYFRSVIVFGQIRIIKDEAASLEAARIIGRRCNPDEKALDEELAKGFSRVVMLEMTIDRITGKQAIEMVKR